MTKIYNLYFGEGKDQLTYYKPSTPEKELQDLIDDPEAWKKYLKDQKDTLELVENERDALDKDNKDLTKDLNDANKLIKELTDFLKDEVGYANIGDFRTALDGHKLPNILQDAEATIKTLKASEDKLKGDIGALNTQILGMVDKDELVKAVNEKNNTITQLGNLGTQYGKLETAYNNLKNPYDALNAK
jgi:chromosome segregation ATPase